MKRKLTYSILIGILLVLSSMPSIQVKAVTPVEDKISTSIPNLVDFAQGLTDSFVIFTKSQDDYNQIMNSYDVIKGYPRLGVVLLKTTFREANDLARFGRISPTSIIPQLYAPSGSLIGGTDGVTLDSLEDAPRMGVDKLWNQGYSGQGIKVGIVDDGIEDHNGLVGRLENLTWFAAAGSDGSKLPEHGIWVAGTIAGTGDVDPLAVGNAPNSTFYMAGFKTIETDQGKAFSLGPNGVNYFDAFEYMLGLNDTVRVVNFSGGGGYWYGVDIISRKFEEANVLLVASAGNEGPGSNTIGCPSCAIPSLSVGATVRDTHNTITSFSSRGPGFFPAMKPDVVAPGQDVYTTGKNNVYERVSGTSFSSPLTVGAIATLMSALNANGIEYNIGSLKAAVLQGAFDESNSNGDYTYGAGIVNISRSFDYLMAHKGASNFGNAAVLTPKSSAIYNYQTLSDITTSLEGFTLVSSNMSDVTLTIKGDLASKLTLDPSSWNTSRYSLGLKFNLDTTGLTKGVYTSTISATLGDINTTATISVNILGKANGKVAMDLRHTDWDDFGQDVIGGSNTGEMVKTFVSKGYWVEEVTSEITSSLLADYDILWMPDPFNLVNYAGEPLLASEKTAIINFVDAGGSVFIDFNGPFLSNGSPGGADVAKIDDLTSAWGIHPYSDESLGSINSVSIEVHNVSSLTYGANTVTQAGNWISFDQSVADGKNAHLEAITGDSSKSNLVTYDQRGGGRVIVTSTNFWMDNFGAIGNYKADGDQAISQNTPVWLGQTDKISKVSESLNEGLFTMKVKASEMPTAKRLKNQFLNQTLLPVSDNGDGTYTITYQANIDGIHSIQVNNSKEYVRTDLILDLTGPMIVPDLANNTVFFGNESVGDSFVKFDIIDTLYDVQFSDLTVYHNGQPLDPVLFRTFYINHVLKVRMPLTTLEHNVPHILRIHAKDNSNHTTIYSWWFWIGQIVLPPPPSYVTPTPTVTSTTTTSTTSTSTTLSTQTTTISSTETSSSQKVTSTAPTPYPVVGLFSSFIALMIWRKRKRNRF